MGMNDLGKSLAVGLLRGFLGGWWGGFGVVVWCFRGLEE